MRRVFVICPGYQLIAGMIVSSKYGKTPVPISAEGFDPVLICLVVLLVFDAFANLCRFAGTLTQIEELGAAHNTVTNDLDAADARAVEREGSFHANAVRDAADGKVSCAHRHPES